jgi:hypothetical protein
MGGTLEKKGIEAILLKRRCGHDAWCIDLYIVLVSVSAMLTNDQNHINTIEFPKLIAFLNQGILSPVYSLVLSFSSFSFVVSFNLWRRTFVVMMCEFGTELPSVRARLEVGCRTTRERPVGMEGSTSGVIATASKVP